MAIVPMTCFSLMAPKDVKDELMRMLQRFGDVHLKAMPEDRDGFLREMPEENTALLEKRKASIRQYIAEIDRFEKAHRRMLSRKDRKELIKRDINMDSMTYAELEQRSSQIDIEVLLSALDELAPLHEKAMTEETLYDIEPWERNRLPDSTLAQIRDAKPIIGTVSAAAEQAFAEDIRNAGQIYAIVRKSSEGQILFILKPSLDQVETAEILAEKHHMKKRSVKAVHMSTEVLAFQQKIDRMISRRHRTDGSLERVAQRKLDLMICYEYIENELLRAAAAQKCQQTEFMFVLHGWVPTSRKGDFETQVGEVCKQMCVLRLEDAQRSAVDTPVKLQNNRFTSAFESITRMYAVPRYNEVDPTPVFAPFYLLFFGMMLADVGYGLLMMIVMFLGLRLIKLKPSTQKMAQFLFYLSFSTIAWGAVYGSFFSGLIPMPALINPNSDYTRVLILSMAFGVLHLIVGLGVKAYIYIREGLFLHALYDIGFWCVTLLSGVGLLVHGYIPALANAQNILWILLGAGMGGILLTNGRSAKTIPGKLASGFYSLYGITNYVSDIVSYSRLMALGLAGGSIGLAINMVVSMVSKSGAIGILFGAVIFIGFNLFNLFISGLSSYVHASRLMYVEFFGKFFTGGGVEFKPLRAKNTYINVH